MKFIVFLIIFIMVLVLLMNLETILWKLDGLSWRMVNDEGFINNFDDDGKMNFEYLYNPNYMNSILKKYYIDNDIKINGKKLVNHPYQMRRTVNGRDYYYGKYITNIPHNNDIYNKYGVRV